MTNSPYNEEPVLSEEEQSYGIEDEVDFTSTETIQPIDGTGRLDTAQHSLHLFENTLPGGEQDERNINSVPIITNQATIGQIDGFSNPELYHSVTNQGPNNIARPPFQSNGEVIGNDRHSMDSTGNEEHLTDSSQTTNVSALTFP